MPCVCGERPASCATAGTEGSSTTHSTTPTYGSCSICRWSTCVTLRETRDENDDGDRARGRVRGAGVRRADLGPVAPDGLHRAGTAPPWRAAGGAARCRVVRAGDRAPGGQIGAAHVLTPLTNAQLVCRILLQKLKVMV